jgi:penicillin-insensitive murein DD-endopeptidase
MNKAMNLKVWAALAAVGIQSAFAWGNDATQGPVEQAVGFYSDGTLTQAMALPDKGDGFMKLFLSRDRAWSTFDLQAVIATAAAKVRHEFPKSERLQVGDMSNRAGGSIGRHASHQNGLDSDIAYLRVNRREQAIEHNGFDEAFVKNGKLTENFDIPRNWKLLQILTNTSRVTRIFVDPVIKKSFCEYAKATGQFQSNQETLRALRPWPNHDDHFHVRLSCPNRSPRCVAQDPPPPGDGCNDIEIGAQNLPAVGGGSPFANIEPGIEY